MVINCICPILGILSDRSGKRGTILLLATSLLSLSHIMMALLNDCVPTEPCNSPVLLALLIFLLGYALFVANIWASLRLVVTKAHRGVAIGIANAFQNIAYLLSNMAIGIVLD